MKFGFGRHCPFMAAIKVIHDGNLMARCNQLPGRVRADVSGAAGNEDGEGFSTHERLPKKYWSILRRSSESFAQVNGTTR